VISLLECRPRDGLSPILIPIGIDALLKKHGVKAAGEFPENSIRIDDVLEHDGDCLEKYWIIDTFLTSEFLKDIPEDSRMSTNRPLPLPNCSLVSQPKIDQ